MIEGGKTKILQFPSHRVKFQYKPIDPDDLDNEKLDEISKSLDDIETLLTFLRNDLNLIRMRIKQEDD